MVLIHRDGVVYFLDYFRRIIEHPRGFDYQSNEKTDFLKNVQNLQKYCVDAMNHLRDQDNNLIAALTRQMQELGNLAMEQEMKDRLHQLDLEFMTLYGQILRNLRRVQLKRDATRREVVPDDGLLALREVLDLLKQVEKDSEILGHAITAQHQHIRSKVNWLVQQEQTLDHFQNNVRSWVSSRYIR